MNDIKLIVAKNIATLRVANQMTQLELAEKLNYSDKAVSKWEHGDSMPDISVLVSIAELFGVSLDYLILGASEPVKTEENTKKSAINSRVIITLISLLGIFLVVLFTFILISLIWKSAKHEWLCFIYALPIATIVWLVLNSIWFNRRRNYFIVSILIWSILLSICLSLWAFGINAFLVLLLGIPGQIIILLCSFIKKNPK